MIKSTFITVLPVCFLIGCSASTHAAVRDDGGVSMDAGSMRDDSSSPICSSAPSLLVDYGPEIPDAGRMAVQIPTIAVGTKYLYFVLTWSVPLSSGSSGGSSGYLMRVAKVGGKSERLAAIPGGGSQASQGLAINATSVIAIQAPKLGSPQGALLRVPIDGGQATVLTSTMGMATAIVADAEHAYFADTDGVKSVLLSDGSTQVLSKTTAYSLGLVGGVLYLGDWAAGAVWSLPAAGGTVSQVATNQQGPLYPQACGEDLCWVNAGGRGTGALMRLVPGSSPVVLASGFNEPHSLVYDDRNFFMTTGASGLFLYRIPSAGGALALVQSEPGITSLALDETCLYWASLRGISVLSRAAADTAGGSDAGKLGP